MLYWIVYIHGNQFLNFEYFAVNRYMESEWEHLRGEMRGTHYIRVKVQPLHLLYHTLLNKSMYKQQQCSNILLCAEVIKKMYNRAFKAAGFYTKKQL